MGFKRTTYAVLLFTLMATQDTIAEEYVVQYASPQLQRRQFGVSKQKEAAGFVSALQTLGVDEVQLDEIDWSVSFRQPKVRSCSTETRRQAQAVQTLASNCGLSVSDVVRNGLEVLIYDFDKKRLTLLSTTRSVPTYYVRYEMAEEKTSNKMTQEEANSLVDRLKHYGAKTKLLQAGATYDDPLYPTKVIRYCKVWYSLAKPAEIKCEGAFETEVFRSELISYGFETKISDKPFTELNSEKSRRSSLYSPSQAPSTEPVTPIIPNGTSFWVGTLNQEHATMPMQLDLKQKDGKIQGELRFSYKKKNYRAELLGEINDNEVKFITTKALEGNVFVPTTYTGRLKSGTLKGTWEYAPLDLAGEFEVTLDKK